MTDLPQRNIRDLSGEAPVADSKQDPNAASTTEFGKATAEFEDATVEFGEATIELGESTVEFGEPTVEFKQGGTPGGQSDQDTAEFSSGLVRSDDEPSAESTIEFENDQTIELSKQDIQGTVDFPAEPPGAAEDSAGEGTVEFEHDETAGDLSEFDLSELDSAGTVELPSGEVSLEGDSASDSEGSVSEDTDSVGMESEGTVELEPSAASADSSDIDAAGTVELSSSDTDPAVVPPAGIAPLTFVMGGDKTLDFDSQEGDDPASMVTSQWDTNVEGDPADVNCTIRQKETISNSYVTSSSLVVKSRQVRAPSESGRPVASPTDAPDYELLEILGEGGMGVVYSARQSSIARTVAVKMLKKDSKSDSQREKFVSEAVITGELDHPNIVPIYDLGSNESGALFYSMKRVKGTPWNKEVKKKSLSENLGILLRVSDAVAFAHANGVIHRDLKPENVMLGDFGEVLVMDWGLARISPEFPNAEAVSQSDVMGGTPAYMAPEMASGPIERISILSDVYLLGAILFEMITSRPPHSGTTVMACLFAAAKNKINTNGHSGELYDIALRAMATEPSGRHASVQEFQDALRGYLSHSESIVLTDSAATNLAEAEQTHDYELHSRAMYGFQEALSMWPENKRAQALLSSSRTSYANSALEKSDFDLGISLLDAENEEHAELLKQLQEGLKERESRKRRITALKRIAASLLLATVGVVTVAYFAVAKQKNIAVKEKAVAVAARAVADEKTKETLEANAVAEQKKIEAIAAKKVADTEAENARLAEAKAKDEEAKAREAEMAAREAEKAAKASALAEVEAKRAKQYEAYVARIGLAKVKIEENAFDRATDLLGQCETELKNWEWGRLEYLCHLSHRTWDVAGPVDAVAFSPDGRNFATGDWTGKARIWDLESGVVLHEFSHGQYAHAVAFDPQGDRLAVGSSDRMVRIYRVADGQLLQTLEGHTDHVISVRFSHDGHRLLSSGFDNTARLWDLEIAQVQQVFRGHTWSVWAAEFSPDDSRILTAGQDGKAIVWQRTAAGGESARFEKMTEFTKHHGSIYAAKFSPDGRQIATAGQDRRVLVWSPDEVQPVDIELRLEGEPDPPAPFQAFAGHDRPVRTLAFSPDGKSLVSGGQDNVLLVWDLSSGRLAETLRGHASRVQACDFSPDGKWLLSASYDKKVKLWEPGAPSDSLLLGGGVDASHPDAVLSARFSRDGSQIVTASRDRTAAVWDVLQRERKQLFEEGHDYLASSAKFFSDGTRVATGAGDGTVRIWDLATQTEIHSLEATGRMAVLDVSDNARWIVTGSKTNNAVVWSAESGEQVAELAGHKAIITAVRFAPDGNLVATGDDHGLCRLWRRDTVSGNWTGGAWLRGHGRTITALAFVEGGSRLVSSSGDNTCGQWNVATGKEMPNLVLSHPKWVAGMDVSSDGQLALTSCEDGRLRLWSLNDARLLRTLVAPKNSQGEQAIFSSAEFSPDGRHALATCSGNGTVSMWNLGAEPPAGGADEVAEIWIDFRMLHKPVWAARYSSDGHQVMTIGGNDAQLWDAHTRQSVGSLSQHGAVASADISPDGKLLVTGSWDQSAKVWNIETGRALYKLDGAHQDYVSSVEFSPDGKTILSSGYDGVVRLWEVATGAAMDVEFQGHKSRVRQARFSHDGRRVLTVSDDKTARIWDAQTGEMKCELIGHQWAVHCGEFSRDGLKVITGSEDKTAIVWDAKTGEALLTLAGHTAKITAVALSPDGSRALTGSDDNTAKLWDARSGEEAFYDGKEILTLLRHTAELTSVSFSPDGQQALTSGRDGRTILWPAVDWLPRQQKQAMVFPR